MKPKIEARLFQWSNSFDTETHHIVKMDFVFTKYYPNQASEEMLEFLFKRDAKQQLLEMIEKADLVVTKVGNK